MASFWSVIDWERPWLAPLRPAVETALETALQMPQWRDAFNAMARTVNLRNHRGLPLRFVPQAELPADIPYEAFISETGQVPTRENLHDFFNALVWQIFPKTKVRLNALQAGEIERIASSGAAGRGRIRDAATIFDENSAILITADPNWIELLRSRQWHELFCKRRAQFSQECEVVLFGHALMEKLVTPYKAITAHVWPLVADPEFFNFSLDQRLDWIDATLARQLSGGLVTSDFAPLPILGVPGWYTGQTDAFYADAGVFRERRSR